MKRKVHYRCKADGIELCKDGMFKKERLKDKTKKIYQKKTRLRLKKEIKIIKVGL